MFPNNVYPIKISNTNKKYIEGLENIKDNIFINNKNKLKEYKKLWKINNNNTNIFLYLKNNNINKWTDTLRTIFWRINFMRKLSNNNKNLEVWIFPLNHKKTIPTNKILTEDNVNSGSTTIYYNRNDNGVICLWRKEEILKVLIHEIIHSFNLDRNHPEPNEAYTELKACLINIYLELLERQIPLNNVNKYIDYEKLFSLEQKNKVCKCFNKNTNIKHYINKKSDLLFQYYPNTVNNDNIWKINNNSLRFTITEHILRNIDKKDFNGKILNLHKE